MSVFDPDGTAWEVYVLLDDMDGVGADGAAQPCCAEAKPMNMSIPLQLER